jgi:hypothetical protein
MQQPTSLSASPEFKSVRAQASTADRQWKRQRGQTPKIESHVYYTKYCNRSVDTILKFVLMHFIDICDFYVPLYVPKLSA